MLCLYKSNRREAKIKWELSNKQRNETKNKRNKDNRERMWVVNKKKNKTKKLDVVFVILPNAGDPFVFFSLFGGRHSVNSVFAFDHFPLGIRFAGFQNQTKQNS